MSPEQRKTHVKPGGSGEFSPLPLYFAAFVMDVGLGIVMMAFPWLAARHFKAGAATIGLISGGATGLYTLSALSAGLLSRKLSPFVRIVFGSLVPAMAFGAAAACASLWQFAVALCMAWLAMGTFWPAMQAQITANCGPEEIQRRVTRFNLSWSVGIMTGPAIAGQVSTLDPRLPFVLGSAMALLATMTAAAGLRRMAAVQPPILTASLVDQPASRSSRFLLAAWCAHFGSYFCSANIRTFFPLLASAHHIPDPVQGYLVLELGLFQTATFFAMSRVAQHRLTRGRTYLFGIGLVILGMVLTAQGIPEFIILAFIASGIGMGTTYVLSLFHSLHSPNAARNAGVHEGIVGGAGICGSFIGGSFASKFGLAAPYYLCGGVVLLVMVAVVIILSRRPAGANSPAPQ